MAKYVEHPMNNFTSRTMCRIRQGIIGTCIPSCPACRISQYFQASSSLSPILIGTSISELLSLPPDPHSLAALGWRCHLYNHGIHAMTAPKFRTQITAKHACPNGHIYSGQDIPQLLQCIHRSSSTSSVRKKGESQCRITSEHLEVLEEDGAMQGSHKNTPTSELPQSVNHVHHWHHWPHERSCSHHHSSLHAVELSKGHLKALCKCAASIKQTSQSTAAHQIRVCQGPKTDPS